jgi:hypothetical protein
MRRSVVVLVLGLVVAGCGADPGASAEAHPKLGISNGTTLTVTIVINDRTVATREPGAAGPDVDPLTLPDLPWSVEARSPSGRVLTSMTVKAGDIWTTARPGGAIESSGAFARVDLSCGSLRIWAGDVIPSGPVPASPAGSPGDCTP